MSDENLEGPLGIGTSTGTGGGGGVGIAFRGDASFTSSDIPVCGVWLVPVNGNPYLYTHARGDYLCQKKA